MIQFNLLPDVKLEYIRAKRTKRLVIAVSTTVSAVSLLIMIGLAVIVFGFQRTYIADMSDDITQYTNELKSTPDLDKVLTVQNQLNSLESLHAQKPATKRMLAYIKQLTPVDASVSSLSVSFTDMGINITGSAKDLKTVNQFVDTLKFTNYLTEEEAAQPTLAFSQVVLTNFGLSDEEASYTIDMLFDPVIFDNTRKVTLSTPDTVTTRSVTEKPGDLFQETESSEE